MDVESIGVGDYNAMLRQRNDVHAYTSLKQLYQFKEKTQLLRIYALYLPTRIKICLPVSKRCTVFSGTMKI